MKLTKATNLLKKHYDKEHPLLNPCGFTTKQGTIFEDLFLGEDGSWEEEDPQEDNLVITKVCCTECDKDLS